MSDFKEKTIDGNIYRVSYLPPRQALHVLGQLGNMLGPALGEFADGLKDGDIDAMMDADVKDIKALSFRAISKELVAHIHENEVMEIVEALAQRTEVCQQAGPQNAWPYLSKVFDQHFTGKMGLLLKWLFFALSVQYSDFFDGWRSRLGSVATGFLADRKGMGSQSPNVSKENG